MKDRPILFSGEMVRSILAGRKTQTRRIVKPLVEEITIRTFDGGRCAEVIWKDAKRLESVGGGTDDGGHDILAGMVYERNPYGRPGDRLWVREAAYIAPPNFGRDSDANLSDDQGRCRVVSWAASSESPEAAGWYGIKKTPSIHMPRWASRLTLEVVKVRVERVQAISDADALAEGSPNKPPNICWEFGRLWDRINGKRAPWASDPWVWVIEFKRVQP